MQTRDVIIFALGSVLGAGVTYFVMKDKANAEVQDEIEIIRNHYKAKYDADNQQEVKEARVIAKAAINKPELPEVEKIIKRNKYTNKLVKEPKPLVIEVITEKDFDEDTDHSRETVNYYEEDGVLADETDEVMFIDDTIGTECLDHFDEEAPDVVYVRNENLGIIYEVIKIHGSYSRIVAGVEPED